MLGTGDDALVAAVLDDWRTAPIDDKLRATLGFLEKVTLSPADVTPDDAGALRAVGVTDVAAREALYVAYIFNVMDRLADAFDFYLPSEKAVNRTAKMLLKLGYRTASVPG